MTVTIQELPIPAANVETEQEVTATQQHGSDGEDQFFDAQSDAGSDIYPDEGSTRYHEAGETQGPSEGCRPSAGNLGEEERGGASTGVIAEVPLTSTALDGGAEERVVEMLETDSHESASKGRSEEVVVSGSVREEERGGFVEDVDGEGGCENGLEDEEGKEQEEEEEVSEEDKQRMLLASEALKQEGNTLFGQQAFSEASKKYTEAIIAGPPKAAELAVYFANRAACLMKLELWKDAVDDCTQALKLKEGYIKALLRRCASYEKMDELESALLDANKVVELEPNNREAAIIAARLQPIVEERREKLKEEMMGKLKDLGNMVLGKFGMSLDNFQTVQDPATGGYSINFKQ